MTLWRSGGRRDHYSNKRQPVPFLQGWSVVSLKFSFVLPRASRGWAVSRLPCYLLIGSSVCLCLFVTMTSPPRHQPRSETAVSSGWTRTSDIWIHISRNHAFICDICRFGRKDSLPLVPWCSCLWEWARCQLPRPPRAQALSRLLGSPQFLPALPVQ